MEAETRDRLLDAVLAELAEEGYGRVDLARATAAAGADPAEAGAEFPDKDACLFAAFERRAQRLVDVGRRARAAAAGETWERRVGVCLAAVLDDLAASPETAHVLTRAFPAISPAARERYQALLDGFAAGLAEGRPLAGEEKSLPAQIELFAVGAAETIVFEEIAAGRARQLPELQPEILFSVLVPFLGPERAAAAMADARRAR